MPRLALMSASCRRMRFEVGGPAESPEDRSCDHPPLVKVAEDRRALSQVLSTGGSRAHCLRSSRVGPRQEPAVAGRQALRPKLCVARPSVVLHR